MDAKEQNVETDEVEAKDYFNNKPSSPLKNAIIKVLLITFAVGMFAGGVFWRGQYFRNFSNSTPKQIEVAKFEPPESKVYGWLKQYDPVYSIYSQIPVPRGFYRAPVKKGSFAQWLRYLPLKPGQRDIVLFNGKPKRKQNSHCAVVDIDVGIKDIHRAVVSIVRLKMEYLYGVGRADEIKFTIIGGESCSWKKWSSGNCPGVKDGEVVWSRVAADNSYKSFHKYLMTMFDLQDGGGFAKDFSSVKELKDMQIGDVFLHDGGKDKVHAVIVVDMIRHETEDKTAFVLVEGGMPTQDIHVVSNPSERSGWAWYPLLQNSLIRTPELPFRKNELLRFLSADKD